jgi:ketosteroid isomerase-like protein
VNAPRAVRAFNSIERIATTNLSKEIKMNRILFLPAISCFALVAGLEGAAAAAADRDTIAATIKAQARDIVTGINTHDAALATRYDASNVIVIQSGQPNMVGVAADLADYKQGFAAAPTWRVSLVEETVDVPASADMAVYRSVYNQDSMHDKVPFTSRVNVISGWSRHEGGAWLMDWYAVSEMEKSHKK